MQLLGAAVEMQHRWQRGWHGRMGSGNANYAIDTLIMDIDNYTIAAFFSCCLLLFESDIFKSDFDS